MVLLCPFGRFYSHKRPMSYIVLIYAMSWSIVVKHYELSADIRVLLSAVIAQVTV
ncbi:protein of unknown function [Vibrio tapetis subsp. tapetis]|uniref:Uncharacterized protein n=1 Tax=Vibrio tapetis subsp. tapetis TaxID=1671868 RepID=A0A2N8Z915_9VIBR|nr:protein of unknown function [Vibrio tapetis subsp. tapetis]